MTLGKGWPAPAGVVASTILNVTAGIIPPSKSTSGCAKISSLPLQNNALMMLNHSWNENEFC